VLTGQPFGLPIPVVAAAFVPREQGMIYINLIFNLSLLVALSIISGFIEKRKPAYRKWSALLQGTLFGGAAIIGLLRPLDLGGGLIFDGRSVVISLCALFFGPMAGAAAAAMAVPFRLWLGGVGALMGGLVILSSMGIGLSAHYRFKPESGEVSVRNLYLMGLAVHVVMIALMFALPSNVAWTTVQKIGLPVLLLYPLATVLGGRVLADQAFAARFVDLLQKAKQNLEVTLRSIGEAVIATDVRGRITLMNLEAERLTGWKSEDAIGKSLSEIFNVIDVDTRRQTGNPVDAVLQSGTTIERTNHSLLVARDGTERHITENASPIRHERGEVTGGVLVFRDVTESYRTQAALRESEESYRRLFQDHAAVKMILDPETGSILDVNKAAVSYYGWPRERLIRMNIKEINTLPPEAVFQEMNKAKTLKRIHFEFRHRRADGSVRDVEVFSSRILLGGKEALHSIVHDVTERKRAEVERERLLAAIEQAGEAVCITDVNGTIQYVNPAFETITGYSRAEAVGENPRILKSGLQDDAFYRNLWETIASGSTWKGQLVNRRKTGELYTEDVTISPVCDATGSIANYVAVKHDITEKQQLTAQLMQAQKMESVGQLAGGVAHDFNNMLTVIIGHTQMLLHQTDAAQPAHADLSAILNAAERSARITRQLLAFARRQPIAPRVLDLNDTVERMLKMLRRLIGEDINLVWSPGRNLWPVRMDPSQIDQVLANLCVNARDAIDGVGKITIETANAALDTAFDDSQSDFVPGDFALLAVSDNGCGMDKHTLDKIFDPFFTTKELGRGTGLGLSTVYGIVKQNNGLIRVYSEPGQGTTFKIYLPREPRQEVESQSDVRGSAIPAGDETLLLVEDEKAILKLGKRVLEQMGYRVLTAETPELALKLAELHAGGIHLLITDVIMPGMNGKDLAERLRSKHPDLKCLYMSGYTANVIAHHGVLDPGVHFIEKPFKVLDLAAKVREVMDAR